MNIILKYIFKSMWERKVYTALIIFSILISSAMFFASVSISQTLVNIQMDTWRNTYGYTDIIIHAGSGSPSLYFYASSAEKYEANMEYTISELSGYASYRDTAGKKTGVSLKGIDLKDLQLLTPVTFYKQYNLYPFQGFKTIISTKASENYGLNTGDRIILEINGAKHRFTVCAIAGSTGPFINEGREICAVIPIDSLRSVYNTRGKVDLIYLKLKNPALKSKLIYRLTQDYSRFTVKEPFTESQIKSQTNKVVTPILIVTIILSFMSIFIIYSTFRIIILERLPVIGAFRSIGATGRASFAVLTLEGIMYGVIGGLLGCVSGIALLYVMSAAANPGVDVKISSSVQFTGGQLLVAFSMAIVLSLAGSFIPIIRVFRVSIKDIINNTIQEKQVEKIRSLILGIFLLSAAISIPFIVSGDIAKWIDAVCMILLLVGMILLIPYAAKILIKLFEPVYSLLFGNEGVLAAKNLKENKSVLSNVSLLVIGISSMFMISTINYGETRQILDCFDRCLYDIYMEIPHAGRSMVNVLLSIEGVEGVCASYYEKAVGVAGKDEPIWHVQGIDTDKFLSFSELRISGSNPGASGSSSGASGNSGQLMKELDKGRNIMLTTTLKDRFGVKAGDIIKLKIRSDGGTVVELPYKIIGFFENITPGRWSYSLISERNFRLDIGNRSYGPIYIKSSGNVSETVSSLLTAFARRKPSIITVSSMKEEALQGNRQLFVVLEGFSLITLAAGTFGILNNMIIGFIQRRRHFAVLRSIGMSRVQVVKMISVEAITAGMIGGLTGISAGVITTALIVPQVIEAMQIETRIYYSGSIFAICFLASVSTTVMASIGPALRLVKLNLIEALKIEL